MEFGACDKESVDSVRKVSHYDIKDLSWRAYFESNFKNWVRQVITDKAISKDILAII